MKLKVKKTGRSVIVFGMELTACLANIRRILGQIHQENRKKNDTEIMANKVVM